MVIMEHNRSLRIVPLVFLAFGACTFNPAPRQGTGTAGSSVTGSGTGSAGQTGTGGSVTIVGSAGSTGGGGTTGAAGTGNSTFVPIPTGYTMANIGAYMLGDPITSTSATQTIDSPNTGCYTIVAIVRDFAGCCNSDDKSCVVQSRPHPDFEHYQGGAQTT